MSLFKKFGQQVPNHVDQLEAFRLDVYERTQLALAQLQTLFLAGELEKQELLNATRMAMSLDKENLTVVEEIIKSKLG